MTATECPCWTASEPCTDRCRAILWWGARVSATELEVATMYDAVRSGEMFMQLSDERYQLAVGALLASMGAARPPILNDVTPVIPTFDKLMWQAPPFIDWGK